MTSSFQNYLRILTFIADFSQEDKAFSVDLSDYVDLANVDQVSLFGINGINREFQGTGQFMSTKRNID